ncbi:MAG: SGNH/GDSL hydrolase family protein [Candidatus Tectomicrobia bacterium]|nr:SGNH/GDSL hydrolase family protein [Candidatus Tectomicrobia bacterium]
MALSFQKKLLFSAVAVAGLALLVEYGSRAGYDLTRRRTKRLVQTFVRGDPYAQYQFRANVRNARIGDTVFSTNAHGFRGPDLPWEAQPGAVRVIAAGDSVTFGWSASGDRTTYPAFLEETLRRRVPGRRVEVVNAGMPRYHAGDVLALTVSRLVFMLPRTVVVMVGANDVLYSIATPPSTKTERLQQWVGRSRLLSLIKDGWREVMPASWRARAVEDLLAARERAADNVSISGPIQFELTLRALVHVLRRQNVRAALVTYPLFLKERMSRAEKERMLPYLAKYPNLSYAGWRRIYDSLRDRVERVAREEGALGIAGHRLTDLRYFADMIHLTDAGNQALAGLVAEGLLRDGVLAQGPEAR